MIERRNIRLVITVILAATWCLLHVAGRTAAPLSSPLTQTKTAGDERTAGQAYKNIRVLNALPASELDGVMEFMAAALGVGCVHCHTNEWESDSKSTKLGTRRMILMTRAINDENFSGNPAITCYTCHQGQARTVPVPPADPAVLHGSYTEAAASKPAGTVSTNAVIDRYIEAIGGDAAIEKIGTGVMRGTETTTDRSTAPVTLPIEIYETADRKLLVVRGATVGSILHGFDGVRGWIRDSHGVRVMDAKEMARSSRDASFFRYLRIKETYPQMRVLARETVGSGEAYVVGATSRDGSREKLYFDLKTGLLVRRQVTFRTAFGGIPEVTDFGDYRDLKGVRLPFTIRWVRPPFGSVKTFSEIRVNAVIDAAKFAPHAK